MNIMRNHKGERDLCFSHPLCSRPGPTNQYQTNEKILPDIHSDPLNSHLFTGNKKKRSQKNSYNFI